MKKITEQLSLKSADGREYLFDNGELYEATEVKVLKSLRTEAGANDWIKLAARNKDARVVDTKTLKSIVGDEEPFAEEFPFHVIVEQHQQVMERIESENIEDVITALKDGGYIELGDMGVSFTEKWYSAVDKFVSRTLQEALKSATEIPEPVRDILIAASKVIKSIPENAEFGHELRDNEEISDEEASEAATACEAPEADTRDEKLDGEEVSDADVAEAEQQSSHTQKGVVGTTFKSLAEAQHWKNPDPSRYAIVPTSFEDKKLYGRNKSYIVTELPEKPAVGSFGNKRL